jgi:hypothetical protein
VVINLEEQPEGLLLRMSVEVTHPRLKRYRERTTRSLPQDVEDPRLLLGASLNDQEETMVQAPGCLRSASGLAVMGLSPFSGSGSSKPQPYSGDQRLNNSSISSCLSMSR